MAAVDNVVFSQPIVCGPEQPQIVRQGAAAEREVRQRFGNRYFVTHTHQLHAAPQMVARKQSLFDFLPTLATTIGINEQYSALWRAARHVKYHHPLLESFDDWLRRRY